VGHLYQTICRAAALAVKSVRDEDESAATEVLALKTIVYDQAERLAHAEATRLGGPNDELLSLTRLRMEAAGDFQRIYDLARRVAEPRLPSISPS
jgi:hypothetical protein